MCKLIDQLAFTESKIACNMGTTNVCEIFVIATISTNDNPEDNINSKN